MKNMNCKLESWRNTVKRKNMKWVTWTWSWFDCPRKQSSKLESSERRSKDSKTIWLMRRANTGSKLKDWSLSSTTTSTVRLKISKSNILIKYRHWIMKTPSWRKSSTPKTWKSKAFWLKIRKSRTITRILSNSWKSKMKTWRTKWSSSSISTTSNWKTWRISWMGWETQS